MICGDSGDWIILDNNDNFIASTEKSEANAIWLAALLNFAHKFELSMDDINCAEAVIFN